MLESANIGTPNPPVFEQKPSFLRRLNEKWANFLYQRLDSNSAAQLDLTLQSARGIPIRLPREQSDAISRVFDGVDINQLSQQAEQLVDSVDDESKLGRKILIRDSFDQALQANFRQLQQEDSCLETALDYWVRNYNSLAPDRNLWRKIQDPVLEVMANLGREPAISLKLLLTQTGAVIEKRFQKVGNYLKSYPVKNQFASDMLSIKSTAEDDGRRDKLIQVLGSRYQLSSDEMDVLAHPSFRERITASAVLQTYIYTLPRQVIGWSAFTGLTYLPEFRNLVDNNFTEATLIAAGFLVAGMIGRARIDYKVLKDRNFSPDILESVLGNLTGKVSSKGELLVNPRAGFLGAPLDVAGSCMVLPLTPPYNVIAATNLPYSIPAYLWAMNLDQVVFAATNVGWGTIMKVKEKVFK